MKFDVIVIGAGHAGIEAAFVAAQMGCSILVLTLRKETIGLMSCNPAIGGVGKGQLVKEIDALGGLMGRAADACGMQFRTLNASKGPAVHSSRAQIDMYRYNSWMRDTLTSTPGVTVREAEAHGLIIKDGRLQGVKLSTGECIEASCVVVAPGTFLDGRIHQGLRQHKGGRISEPSSEALSDGLQKSGFRLMRFKTGTCPRLDKATIDFSRLSPQYGDDPPQPFSLHTEKLTQKQIPCYITYTNQHTHRIILDNLDRSPLYTGIIQATGVRYCPSVEDKIVRFRDKPRHQVFLEPQGYESDEVYPNGLSTSLPEDVQTDLIRSIEGLEDARIVRFGYGIEHAVIEATQLYPTLESKSVRNLFFAGQINGTTGYEEAAAQGLLAGINAALCAGKREPFVLDRSSSYIGVLIDDLTTKGTQEPYRMFTSRVEYRLLIREDNADLRLRESGYRLGIVRPEEYKKTQDKRREFNESLRIVRTTKLSPSEKVNTRLLEFSVTPLRKTITLYELLKRPHVSIALLKQIGNGALADFSISVLKQLEIEVKYSGFIRRQLKDVDNFKYLENIRLDPQLDYTVVRGLSREIQEKLSYHRPLNLGQASRISGVTPAAISILMVYVHKHSRNLK